ncbi:DUF2853 family protein [Sulfurovum sp. zt1-1]|uniref:DUF2853 family protein n=1 Tax=Sulfurovum zhangzhouensis TaxID=3019067 RepID=A0ABT7QZZ9_9BACT|nr:DUF2853 family protein [Sulfurovum zhangzhouensis]MDM5272363.1 DUF2853 family protein [Sulfurovum zhangzhouensis]
MSKLDEKVAHYVEECKKLGLALSSELIEKVTIALGPSIYNNDSEIVSCTDESEVETVRENFLKNKLGLTQSDKELDAAIANVCEMMGNSNRHKYRALFYAQLAKNFGKTAIYD